MRNHTNKSIIAGIYTVENSYIIIIVTCAKIKLLHHHAVKDEAIK